MTSRERVLSAINHREPDRVPVDLGSNPSSGISAIAYGNLLKYLGKDYLPVEIYDVVQQLAQPHDEILDLFGIDVIDLGRAFNQSPGYWCKTQLMDGQEAFYPQWFRPVQQPGGEWIAYDDDNEPIAKMPLNGTFFDSLIYPWENGYPDSGFDIDKAMAKSMWSAFVHSPWDLTNQDNFWDNLRNNALRLRESTDRAIMLSVGCNLFEWGTFIRRMDIFMMDLFLEKGNVERLLDGLVERHLASLENVCRYVGDIVDIVRFGDDLGMTNGPFMGRETYNELFRGRHKVMTDYVKSNSSMSILLHSCGSIYELIPDLIEAGFDILNPVQTNCRDMDPLALKSEFGSELTFWGGGIETAGTLNAGTTEDVRRETLRRLEIFSTGGGYIFNTVHNILPDVPATNIVAMFDAVKEFNG